MNVLIIGYGTVGKNLHKELEALHPDVWDIKFDEKLKCCLKDHYDVAFICVDTPYTKEDVNDITQVRNVLNEYNADIFVLKSTVLPGTTNFLIATTGKHIIMSPEYYGGTQHCNNFEFNFTILGGEKEDCLKVQQLLQNVYDARHTFHIVDAKTAELAKYMENCWLATKVSFCCQFHEIAKNYGLDYETLRELFILDPRVNPSHTFVYDDHPYWSSHCLDKDVPAIAYVTQADLLNAVIEYNNKFKNK